MRPRSLQVIPALLLCLALAACGQEVPPTTGPVDSGGGDEPTSSDLVAPVGGDLRIGEPWYLLGGTLEKQTSTQVTLTFDEATVGGQGPINTYSAEYSATPDGALELGEWGTTLIGSDGPDPAFEAEILQLLGTVDGYTTVAAGELYLFDGDVNVLVYATAPPADDDLTITEETEALAAEVVGMAEDEARATVEAADHVWRVVARDGTSLPVTEDYSPTRINATIVDGTVTGTTIG